MPTAYIALGSNVGDRRDHLRHGLNRLGDIGSIVAGSPIYETSPVGGPSDQGPYLNAVVSIETMLRPEDLLEACLGIERERGRTREVRWGPRTLDLDIVWYDGETIDTPGLTIPHRELRRRPFVLAPLLDIAPGLGDGGGPYAEAFGATGAEGLVRITGPVAPDATRWMVGLADAVSLVPDGEALASIAHRDWANTNGDAFGGFLAAIALEAVRHVREGARPSHLTYRFLHPVAAGSDISVSYVVHRDGAASADLTISLRVDGVVVGRCAVGLIDRPLVPVDPPPMPSVMPMHDALPVTDLIGRTSRSIGSSIRSWTPLERWDVPDLASGNEAVLRAWTPNVALGMEDPFLKAATVIMPIDALIWPATMQRMERLPDGPMLSTPTIELTARFASFVDDPWLLGEASVDHVTDRTVAGTVRVWGGSGHYLAVGHSLNLVR